MISKITSALPVIFWVLVLTRLVYGGIVLYTIHRKGNFRVEYSRGRTTLRLEAWERVDKKP